MMEKPKKDENKDISISEVQIFPIKPKDGCVAFASCILNKAVYIGSIGIHVRWENPEDFYLAFPNKQLPNGRTVQCVHPITRVAGDAIREAVIARYRQISNMTAEHSGTERLKTTED